MKLRLAAILYALPVVTSAQELTELSFFGAMLEGRDGTPLATATRIAADTGSDPKTMSVVTSAEAVRSEGACVRHYQDGACHEIISVVDLPGVPDLAVAAARVGDDDLEFLNSHYGRRMPIASLYDPRSDGGLTFVTQGEFGGWERPLALASPTGTLGGLVLLAGDAFSQFSVGAPMVHPEKGIVGVVARTRPGTAAMIAMPDLIARLEDVGVTVLDEAQPSDLEESGLPARVASEVGLLYVFSDNSYIGYMSGWYGPVAGGGFDPDFVTDISFSVWGVDLAGNGGTRIAGGEKTVPLVATGMSLEAPFQGTPSDHLATCVTLATPSSDGRVITLLQFFRAAPERYDFTIDDKSYDEAAPPLMGWAEGTDPCARALDQVDESRIAALAQEPQPGAAALPHGARTADTSIEPRSSRGSTREWASIDGWDATGRTAFRRTLAGGQVLTIGCTESQEIAVSVEPGGGVEGITIDGEAASYENAVQEMAYAILPAHAGVVLGMRREGVIEELVLPGAFGACSASN